MPKITIDGREVEIEAGATIIRAIDKLGIDVPRYCYHPRLPVAGNCRMCLVEVEKAPKLVTSCTTPVADGMVVYTANAKVKEAQAVVLEFLLLNHPLDCPICDKAGECMLQDQYFQYSGRDSRLGQDEKTHKPKAVDLGNHIVLDAERCVLCTRCIRFMENVAGDPVLGIQQRGDHSELTVFPGKRLDSRYSLNTTDVCPVGALTSKEFRFRKRVWFLKHTKSVCPNCSTGCPVILDHEDGKVYRMMPGTRDGVETWLCDPGRQGFDFVNDPGRPKMPVKISMDARGTQVITSWDDAIATVVAGFHETIEKNGAASVGAIFSNWATNEEAFAFLKLTKSLGTPNVALHDPMTGLVDTGPADDILIREDKNPNTLGVREIAGALKNSTKPLAELLDAIKDGKIKALYVCDPDIVARTEPGSRKRLLDALKKVKFLVVQSPISTELTRQAHVHLASATWAEKEGTFTNAEGVVQKIRKAFKLPGEILPDLEIFVRLSTALGHKLPFTTAGQAMAALAKEIPAFKDVQWNALAEGYAKIATAAAAKPLVHALNGALPEPILGVSK